MRFRLLLAALFAACCATPAPRDDAAAEALGRIDMATLAELTQGEKAASAAFGVTEPNLYEVRLPPGDSGSINIGWFDNGVPKLDPRTWLDDGDHSDHEPDDYDGVKFVGAGIDVTHLRCTSYDGRTVAAIQHNGIVQLENLTVHTGALLGVGAGEQNTAKKLSPKFELRLINMKVVADPPATYGGTRTKWLVFTYQADLFMRGVTLVGKEAREHDVYQHGFAGRGAWVEGCDFQSAAAEGYKVRSDDTETVATPGARIVLRGNRFADWRQDWSDRGGAGIVLQGSAADVKIEFNIFRPGSATARTTWNERSHCIEIAAEANSYDAVTGRTGVGFGNGHVLIRNNAMEGRSLVPWSNTILRVARNSGSQMSARSVTVEECGIWGQDMTVQIGQVPAGAIVVRNCNTEAARRFCRGIGMQAAIEATFPTADRRIPISEGITR